MTKISCQHGTTLIQLGTLSFQYVTTSIQLGTTSFQHGNTSIQLGMTSIQLENNFEFCTTVISVDLVASLLLIPI